MPEREIDRRERERRQASASPQHREAHPVLALQRAIGNRAVAQVLARAPAAAAAAAASTVQIHGVGDIKAKGGNLEEWTAGDVPNTLDVTSHRGRHSAHLEKLATAQTKTDVKVTIPPANQAGQELSLGAGTMLEIKSATVKDYAVEGGVETWRLADFTNVHRTKVRHTVG